MIRIVATDEQAESIADVRDRVEVVDRHGKRLGYFVRPVSSDEIRLAQERLASEESRRPTSSVLERLQSLESP